MPTTRPNRPTVQNRHYPGPGATAPLLDLMLPDGDGMEVCKAVCQHSNVPILMVTARAMK